MGDVIQLRVELIPWEIGSRRRFDLIGRFDPMKDWIPMGDVFPWAVWPRGRYYPMGNLFP